jgi:histidinol-phosphate aminotransferase
MKREMRDITLMIRPCCSGFQPYVAGKPIETIKRELGLKKVIKLASNENPLGPSRKALDAVRDAVKNIYFYPDSNFWTLRQTIAKKFQCAANQVILGAGSDEIIELIAKVFFGPQDEIVISEHAFLRYKMAGDLMGSKVVTVPMKQYTHDLPAMAEAVTPRTKAVFICNPNNPTGTYNTTAELERFLNRVRAKAGADMPLVIVDEAYYEYAQVEKDYPQTLAYLSRYPNLIVLRTFSKVYALAGLRVGYGFAAPGIVDFIDRIRPPFNVNSIAQVAAVASLGDAGQVTKGVRLVVQQKNYLYREFQRLAIPYVPSASNFVLFDVSPFSGKEIFTRLLKEGVIARAMDEYDYPQHVRVTVGLPEENKFFIKALTKVMGKQ